MRRVAVISLHTSPLAAAGSGDSGGMNVYVREMVSSLSQAGVECTTYTRADREGLPYEVRRRAQPSRWCSSRPVRTTSRRRRCPRCSTRSPSGVLADIAATGGADVVHANYWLSGVVAHRIKHVLDIPFVSTFHTLARVKAEGGDPEPGWRDTRRGRADQLRRRRVRQLRRGGAAVPAAVRRSQREDRDHRARGRARLLRARRAIRGPGRDRPAHRRAGDPVRRADPAAQGARRGDPCARTSSVARDALLLIVGGASGVEGDGEVARAHQLVDELGLVDQVRFVPPQPHHILSHLLPRGRRGDRPQPERELRARRARSGGLRHPGRRQRRRRPAVAGRGRRDRLPRAAARPRPVRRRHRPHPRRPVAGGVDVGGIVRARPSTTRGASPPPGCGACTPT